jgi:hypothetical protein
MTKEKSFNALYVRLMGGLGNQLFQYAAARSRADELGVELVLDRRYAERKAQHTGLAIDHFAVRAGELSVAEGLRFSEIKLRMARLLKKYFRPVFGAYWEHQFNFDEEVSGVPSSSMLCGFWQSERYITDPQKIRSDLVLNTPLSPAAASVAATIGSCQSVALHVRRGDYLKDQKSMERYGLCSIDYYQAAIAYVLAQVGNATFFVFSDDPTWVKEHLSMGDRCTFVSCKEIPPQEDLLLMSLCQHQIIANSTFSWWGAWLNKNYDKIVVAPTPWFDDQTIAAQDLIPHKWHQIKK